MLQQVCSRFRRSSTNFALPEKVARLSVLLSTNLPTIVPHSEYLNFLKRSLLADPHIASIL
eukprot:scaffold37787_cov153-Skeletonema_marinoi.AAC.25